MLAEARGSTNAAINAANSASDANRLQREIFESENRAWLVLEQVAIVSDLMWIDQGTRVIVHFSFNNYGRLPAKDASFDGGILLDFEQALAFLEQKEPTILDPIQTFTCFPSHSYSFKCEWPIPRLEILERFERSKARTKAERTFISPILFGMVTYSFTFGTDQLRFAYQIFRMMDNKPGLIGPSHGDVPKEQLRLVPFPPENVIITG